MSADAPTVSLADEFSDDLVELFAAAMPGFRVSETVDPESAYLVTWMTDVDEATLRELPNLKAVVRLDSGSGTIDETACHARDVHIGIAASPALVSVAEHTVMLILAVFKRLGPALDRTRAGAFADGIAPMLTNQEEYAYNWVGLERFEAVSGKTVGLVGLGRIGRDVATRLRGFDVDVVYTKRNRLSAEDEEQLGVRFLPFDELLRSSHCVSLHNRFYAETEAMMGDKEFAAMPAGSFFVNTARGRLVDEAALAAALRSGHIAGAAIDVAWYEPPQVDSELWQAPNLLITPHTAGIPIAISLAEELSGAAAIITDDWSAGAGPPAH